MNDTELKLSQANKNLSKKLANLKSVEFDLQLAREKIEHLKLSIKELEQSKLRINSIHVRKHEDKEIVYVGQITDIHETPNGVIVEVSI